jgi:hypothetical protein
MLFLLRVPEEEDTLLNEAQTSKGVQIQPEKRTSELVWV